jgi:radical SAM superfamily enzyme YgiQ (UPF0313 family)
MRIVFLEPPLDLRPRGIFPRHPPQYALTAAAVLRQAGHDVALVDAFHEDLSLEESVRKVLSLAPGMLVIVPYDYTRETHPRVTEELAHRIAARRPDLCLGLAGSVDEAHFRRRMDAAPELAFACIGEYENTLLSLAAHGAPSDAVPGLLVRRADSIVATGPADVPQDLDALPYPAWDLVDFARYIYVPHRFRRTPMYPLLAGRGCPFACLCCKEAKYARITRYRLRSVESVMAEIRHAVTTWGAREIQFSDATFGLRKRWVLELCEAMQESGLGLSWSAITRVDVVDAPMLGAMKKAGCWNLLYGVESANQHALDLVKKRIDVDRAMAALRWTREAGIESTASFILGLPGEDTADILRTIRFAARLDPDYAQFFLLKYYGDDSALDEWGRVEESWDFSPHDFRGPIFVSNRIASVAELKRLQRLAYATFYLRPRFVGRHLRHLASPGQWSRYAQGLKTLLGAVARG